MKYVQRTSHNITSNFLVELMKDRGIINDENCETFFNPDYYDMNDPLLLDNIEVGADLLIKHLERGSKIYLPIDPDVDGFTSASVFYNYLNENLKELYPNFTIEYHVPEGKAHGLETIMDLFSDRKKYDLICCLDSSSNEEEYHKILSEMGYDILVLDHHIAHNYSSYATVINNQLSEYYPNKELSGVGVVYKFLQVLDMKLNLAAADRYLDLVALGIISDMCRMTTIENRFICDYGLIHINNKFLEEIIEKQSYSLGKELTQIGVAFYITPLINALIRVGNQKEKEDLFLALIDSDRIVPSTKRGEKGMTETICTQSVRNCVNSKVRQNREKERAMELLDIQILENCLDENKIIILNADDLNVSNTLTGLCAMGVAAKYKKPVMLGRLSSEGYLRGSMRGQGESELKDFQKFLLDSGYFEYVEG